ncbi:hypothetical protein BACCOP_01226, partial [Phocaeicola coprocola DSM 17136]
MLADNTSYSKEFADVLKKIFGYYRYARSRAILTVDGITWNVAYKDHLEPFRYWG